MRREPLFSVGWDGISSGRALRFHSREKGGKVRYGGKSFRQRKRNCVLKKSKVYAVREVGKREGGGEE